MSEDKTQDPTAIVEDKTGKQPPANDGATLEKKLADMTEILARHDKKAKAAEEKLQKILAENAEKEKAAELAKLTEVERLTKINEELASKLVAQEEKQKKQMIESKLELVGMKEGIRKTDYLKLLDRGSITIDDSGNVVGIPEAIAAFKEANPDLFGVPTGEHRPDGQRPNKDDKGNELKPLTSEEYLARERKNRSLLNPY